MNRLLSFCMIALCFSAGEKAFAFAMPVSMPLSQTMEQSTIVAVVTLANYQGKETQPQGGEKLPNGDMAYVGPAILTSFPMKPAGHYTFNVIKSLKGKIGPTIELDLPSLLYECYGGAGLTFQKGSKVVVFLQGSAGSFVPTDPTLPFVPLTPTSAVASTYAGDVQSEVYSLMLASCSDAKIRQCNSHLLRTVTLPQIVTGLFPYIDDPNPVTQDNVLYCMAANQQVAAIPRIAALETKTMPPDRSTQSTLALGHYLTPEAVPYLNPMLFSRAYYVRLNTMASLNRIADNSSIPYLMLAIRDPDYQHFIPDSAYGVLHRLIPYLGPAYGSGYFSLHRPEETGKLYAWWADELLGKHFQHGNESTLPSPLPDSPSQLNPLLFTRDTVMRRSVVAKLNQTADASSIPFLILALQDPDPKQTDGNVSYVAYKTLYKLIPALGQVQSQDRYWSDRDAAVQPIYDWWEVELNGKHLR